MAVLAKKQGLDEEEYVADREQRAIVEREFQTAIEACIDIASLLCKELGGEVPERNAEKFVLRYTRDVLAEETAARMKEAAGFRNVLAHNHGEDIDDRPVYRSLQTDLDWSPRSYAT